MNQQLELLPTNEYKVHTIIMQGDGEERLDYQATIKAGDTREAVTIWLQRVGERMYSLGAERLLLMRDDGKKFEVNLNLEDEHKKYMAWAVAQQRERDEALRDYLKAGRWEKRGKSKYHFMYITSHGDYQSLCGAIYVPKDERATAKLTPLPDTFYDGQPPKTIYCSICRPLLKEMNKRVERLDKLVRVEFSPEELELLKTLP